MRLNPSADFETTPKAPHLSGMGIRVRELSETEIIERIVKRTGPGSLMNDLARMPAVPERIGRIRLR